MIQFIHDSHLDVDQWKFHWSNNLYLAPTFRMQDLPNLMSINGSKNTSNLQRMQPESEIDERCNNTPNHPSCWPSASWMASPKSATLMSDPFALLANKRFSGWQQQETFTSNADKSTTFSRSRWCKPKITTCFNRKIKTPKL